MIKLCFGELEKSYKFEDITKGRKAAVLVNCNEGLVPLYRSTTEYKKHTQLFNDVIELCIEHVKTAIGQPDFEPNSAMIEIYTDEYRKMKFHSDQSLDLQDDSTIAIFSCYEDQSETNLRKLVIKNKESGDISAQQFDNMGTIAFDTNFNKLNKHAIILEGNKPSSRWIVITFRTTKTFVVYENWGGPYIVTNPKKLTLATESEKKEFYKLKGLENSTVLQDQPDLTYTISKSDLVRPY